MEDGGNARKESIKKCEQRRGRSRLCWLNFVVVCMKSREGLLLVFLFLAWDGRWRRGRLGRATGGNALPASLVFSFYFFLSGFLLPPPRNPQSSLSFGIEYSSSESIAPASLARIIMQSLVQNTICSSFLSPRSGLTTWTKNAAPSCDVELSARAACPKISIEIGLPNWITLVSHSLLSTHQSSAVLRGQAHVAVISVEPTTHVYHSYLVSEDQGDSYLAGVSGNRLRLYDIPLLMNSAFPEMQMLHCLQPPSPDNIVSASLDENAVLHWQQEQQSHLPQFQGIVSTSTNLSGDDLNYYSSQAMFSFFPPTSSTQLLQYPSLHPTPNPTSAFSLFPSHPLNGCPHFPQSNSLHSSGLSIVLPPEKQSGLISRTISCPPHVGIANIVEVDIPPPSLPDKIPSSTKETPKKRKTDKVNTSDDCKEKRTKREGREAESNVHNNGETSTGTSKENSKVTEVQKPEYIHVRARRGQATDSHSLAERVRREKISERMKYLQDLVPGCNKITGKAGMLDEIINYVQSLQRQVEFLSMKLAALNPRLDSNIDNFFGKEMSVNNLAAEMMANQGSVQFGFSPPVLEHAAACCGANMAINPPQDQMALRRTTSAPVTAPDASLIDSNFHFQVHAASSACWNVESRLHSFYKADEEDPQPVFSPDQAFRGHQEGSNLKMEM
ncbi:hypothetical protein H6P81_009629 [Aristolochia fimbriata]|uniref:BHLH domain-containing protein n=1 Tax=Aristolochia fimbriata TaxID=158543 RepID=A0AAV7EMM6_ARIFI|nr:hypothetical protein H6P81_009629 [Aristolochia fimbriata]